MNERNGIRNTRITNVTELEYTADQFVNEVHPASDEVKTFVRESRQTIQDILDGKDSRRLAVVGQCSIHDEDADMELTRELAGIAREVSSQLFIVKRDYFEKPRSSIGWKGLIYDPGLDASFDIKRGFPLARRILIATNELGLPTATEFLGPEIAQYFADLYSYGTVGARTTYSQTHRELASGLSMPVGMKNGGDGNLAKSVDSVYAVSFPGVILANDEISGRLALFETSGHTGAHLVLRGGDDGTPNYDAESVATAIGLLNGKGLPARLIIDCSHDNTFYEGTKDYRRQEPVFLDVGGQMRYTPEIRGVMMEVNLVPGQQKIPSTIEEMRTFDKSGLIRGQSITDGCLGIDTARGLIQGLYKDMSSTTFYIGKGI